MGSVRKLIAMALLALFGLPFASTLFALTGRNEAKLPACCRRSGAHHCAMHDGATSGSNDDAAFRGPAQRCPFAPSAPVRASHTPLFGLPEANVIVSDVAHQPAVVAQAEGNCSIARDRARQKRGPPSASLS
jgi:hypothetical protein